MKKIPISNQPDWPEIDPLFITLIDRIAEEPRPSPILISRENHSHDQAYVVNHLTGQSRLSYLPPDCEGNSAWQYRWPRKGNSSAI
jgi:hypothetical protein